MTSFHDESRQRLGNLRPTWLGAPRIALPHLTIDPQADGDWLIFVMVTDPNATPISGAWVSRKVPLATLAVILEAWAESPELTLETHFGHAPPQSQSRTGANGAGEVAVARTATSAEELDL